jgi:hypothetical protein
VNGSKGWYDEVKLHGMRQDAPPMMVSIDYEIIVDTDEDDRRLELLHTNVRKYGTISNTVAKATKLEGTIRRACGNRHEGKAKEATSCASASMEWAASAGWR